MTVFHLVLGALGLALGTVMITRRHNPLRKTSASNRIASPALWTYLGVLFNANGTLQLNPRTGLDPMNRVDPKG